MQEGKGIFSKLTKLIKKGVKFLKGKKVISRVTGAAAPLIGLIPGPKAKAAAVGLRLASAFAKQQGFGLPKKIKSLTPNQVEAILRGFARQLGSGGVSLAAAKKLFPRIKNITPTQMRALAAFRGRHQKCGGVALCGGPATTMKGLGLKLAGQGLAPAGAGLRLAGQGPKKRKVAAARVRKAAVKRRAAASRVTARQKALLRRQAALRIF